MSIGFEAVLGAGLLTIGFLMSRWASRYDVKSWFTDAMWRFIFRKGWKQAGNADIKQVLDADGELRRQISEKSDAFRADAARIGQTRAAAKHGALFAIAYAVNFLSGPVVILAFLILAHTAYRWLA